MNYELHVITSLKWLALNAAVLLTVSLVYKFVSLEAKAKLWTFVDRSLMSVFALLWSFGFVIYAVGAWMPDVGEAENFGAVVPFAIIDATKMFVFSSDLPGISPVLRKNAAFMIFFGMIHFAAAFFSLIFVLRHFGFYLVEKIRVWLAGLRSVLPRCFMGRSPRRLFIIYGTDERSLMMAESIRDSGEKCDIAVIQCVSDDEMHSSTMGISRILGRTSLRNNVTDCLRGKGYLIMFTKHSLAEGGFADGTSVIRDALGLGSLDRIMRRARGEIMLFFLGDDDGENVCAAVNVLKDATLKQAESKGGVRIFCRARAGSINSVVENSCRGKNTGIKIVDEADISVEILKMSHEHHPVNFVDVDEDGRASSPFHSMVVGLGCTGQAAVRFLYEFGAFVGKGSTDDVIVRSPFRCDAVDKDMDRISAMMREEMPSVSMSSSGESLIVTHHADYAGAEFSQKLAEWVRTLNYVVIAAGNDEENMQLAVRILQLAIRYRKDMENFCINVRIARDADGHLGDTARHYNRLVAAEMCAGQYNAGRCHQGTVRADEVVKGPLVVFGAEREIYTFEHIVKERLRSMAMLYKERYDSAANNRRKQSGLKESDAMTWDTEQASLMQLEGQWQGYAPTYSAVMRLRRIQSQNIQNCFHLLTKRIIAQRALGSRLYAELLKNPPQRREGTVVYENAAGSIPRVLHTLARMEHLRWVASHEVLGYSDYATENDKDEARLLHGCMKPWRELSETMQSYDYNVVDLAFSPEVEVIFNSKNNNNQLSL